jgi:site-specific DNA-methyltransferase (adenine-specific)
MMDHECYVGDAAKLDRLADQSVDLVLGSPPYQDQRVYEGLPRGSGRRCQAWVDWMLTVTREALRVSRGPVLWVVGNPVKARNYQPGIEGLIWNAYLEGIHSYRPIYWHHVGIPGSGGDQWFRGDIEHVLCFKKPGKLPFADPLACAKPPKYAKSGGCTNRQQNGTRRDTSKYSDGKVFRSPALANPGNLISVHVGKGHMGSDLAHENEAPYPESLVEKLILSLCPVGGTVLDPFCGSGTTQSVAIKYHRKAIGIDLRQSQVDLSIRRVRLTTPVHPVFLENPHRRTSVVLEPAT